MEMSKNLEAWIKILSLAGAAIAFCWGVIEFASSQHAQMETRRIEATKPFLERQLTLYTTATQAAATLATSDNPELLAAARTTFWSLYWGELALVEDKRVETAMVRFGKALEGGATGRQLQSFSLQLARACRDSLADSWGVRQWRNPHAVAKPRPPRENESAGAKPAPP